MRACSSSLALPALPRGSSFSRGERGGDDVDACDACSCGTDADVTRGGESVGMTLMTLEGEGCSAPPLFDACLGLIGGLSAITMFVDRMNSNISRSSELFVRLSGSGAEPKKTAAPTLQDGDEGIEREAERDAAMKELLTITRVLDARLTEQQQQLHNLAEQQKELQSTLRLALPKKTMAIVESESDAGREEQTHRRKTRVRSRSRHNGEGVVTRRATTD